MILKIENGTFAYKNGSPLFSDVNFELHSGDIISILGPNGAGKTTMLRAIIGILPWSSGRSLLDNEDIKDLSPAKMWSKVSYVPQSHGLAGSYTVLDSVLFGMTPKIGVFSSPGKEDIEHAESILDRLQLTKLRNRKCNELSGGELQMTLIARAMASDPGIIILDEPESNLDFKNQIIVLDTLTQLSAEGVGVLFNTHYPDHALRRSGKAFLLDHGKVRFGATKEIITEENLADAFGVKAIIGRIETDSNQIDNVIPVSLLPKKSDTSEKEPSEDTETDTLASISIICSEFEVSGRINTILHEYPDILFGRMGMPHRKRNVYLINVNLDGPKRRIEELSHRLSLLPSVSVKVTYVKEEEHL